MINKIVYCKLFTAVFLGWTIYQVESLFQIAAMCHDVHMCPDDTVHTDTHHDDSPAAHVITTDAKIWYS